MASLRHDRPRNRLIATVVLATAAVVMAVFGTRGTEAQIGHLLTLVAAWATSALIIVSGIAWIRASTRWQILMAAAAATALATGVAGALNGRPPVGLAVAGLVGFVLWQATGMEAHHREEWSIQQRLVADQRARVRSKEADIVVQEGSWERTRDATRQNDAATQYPATLREFRARRLREEGDPYT